MAGLFGAASSSSSQQNNTLGDLSKDVTVKNPPEDSISDLAFSSQSEHLAVASWDSKVRIYEVGANGEAEGKASLDFKGPVLSCHWSKVSPHDLMYLRKADFVIGWSEGCGWRIG